MLPGTVERWRPLATRSAIAAGAESGVTVPVELVLSIVAQESAGDPTATRVEPDGRVSRGLMQLLDATAAGIGYTTPAALYDPQTNLNAGSRYLARQLKRYGGNVPNAVAAYNAGSARFTQAETFVNQSYVDRVLAWLKKAGPVAVVGTGAAVIIGVGLILLWLASRPRRTSRAAA